MIEFLPLHALERHHSCKERIYAHIALHGALAVYLLIVVELILEPLHAGIDYRIQCLAFRAAPIEFVESLHVRLGIDVALFYFADEVIELVRVCLAGERGCLVILLECLLNHLRVIREVQDESVLLLRVATV